MKNSEEIEGVVERIVHHDAEDDFWVLKLRDKRTIIGRASDVHMAPGLTFRFWGRFQTHKTHGKQFHFVQWLLVQPYTQESIVAYLERYGTSIGKGIALRLYKAFGADTLDVVRDDPAKALTATGSYWKSEHAYQTSSRLKHMKEGEGARLRLIGLLHGRGFPSATIEAIIAKIGYQSYEKIKRDPFILMIEKIPGCGFKRCDALYTDLGLPPGRLRRQMLAAWYAIRNSDDGDTWILRGRAEDMIARYVSGATIRAKEAIDMGVTERWLATATLTTDLELITTHERASEECDIFFQTMALNGIRSSQQWPNAHQISALSDDQQSVMSELFRSNLFILRGSAGTGKTHVAAATIKSVYKHTVAEMALSGQSNIPGQEAFPFFVAAPTGKAVRRLKEFLSSEQLKITPMTIHSLLSPRGSGESISDWRFFWCKDNKLPCGYYFIDEASMVSTDVMASLLNAIPVGSKVMFIADTHQLPPVGSGAPIRDMIRAGVPNASLTEIHRHGGDMLRACEAIRRGSSRIPKSDRLNPKAGKNLWNIRSDQPVKTLLSLLGRLDDKGHSVHDDIQVITLLNKSGEVNRELLNSAIQNRFNPNGKGCESHQFRQGDKIMCTRNGFVPHCCEPDLFWSGQFSDMAEWNAARKQPKAPGVAPKPWSQFESTTKAFLCNGEIGQVAIAEARRLIAYFKDPDRLVVLPLRKKGDDENEYGEVNATWTLAYACTVHKAQGSQWPIVILMLPGHHDMGARMLAGRELYYTALSRASLVTFVIGDWSLMEQQIAQARLPQRRTLLAELLCGDPEIREWNSLKHHSQLLSTHANSTHLDSETSLSDAASAASR